MKKCIFLLFALITFRQHFAMNPYDIQFRNPIKFLYTLLKQIQEKKDDQEDSAIGVFGLATSINNDTFIKNVKQLLKKAFPAGKNNQEISEADVHQLCQMITPHNVNIKDKEGKNILHLLVEHSTAYGPKKKSIAIQSQKATLIKHFITCGIDINSRDNLGNTALHYVHSRSELSKDILEYIILHGARINARNNAGETPIITVTKAASGYSSELIKIYVAHGADVNACDDKGENALLAMITKENAKLACWIAEKSFSGFGRTIDVLIQSGINLKASNNRGETVLHKAVEAGDRGLVQHFIMEQLVSAEENPVVTEEDFFKVHIASNLSKKDIRGRTPLDIAIGKNWRLWNNNEGMIKLLIEHGAKRGVELE